jgi:DNA repair exonuclease SbcCD ATPase subunit/DNA repair exonuclease SbcCD nuclease subunit
MIERIYHLADLHITANPERKEEYEKVLERTIEIIKNDKKEKIVVIVGDLFHEKTKPYQEANVMARNFMKKLGEICEIVIIAGNHDISINNENRTDSIEATLCNLTTKNKINYLTENKIYKICGINFGLTKMMDTIVTKIEHKKEGELYVGLYHGTLYKSKTDDGYEFEDDDKIKASDFKEYDITLLGDIHKKQFMDKNKTIGYCGSLIQQNFGETINNHGMLIWNIKTKKSEFQEVKNDYVYKTYEIKDTNDININEIEDKNCRLRIIYENIERVELLKYEKKIRKKYKILSIIRNEKIKESNKSNDKIECILNKKFMNVYKEFIKKENIKENENVTKMLTSLIDKEHDKIKKSKKEIKLHEIEFENLITYGTKNVMNFNKLKGINILTGKNGLGKSSIIDILLFIIYNKYSRGEGKDILNVRYKNGYGILRIELNGIKYTIERKIFKNKTEVHIFKDFLSKSELNEELKSGKKNISDDGKRNIDKQIIDMFGTYNDMTITSIILQIGKNFVDVDDKDKKKILIEILGLNIYETIKDICKKKYSEYFAIILKKIENKITDVDYLKINTEYENEIKNKELIINETTKKMKNMVKEKNILEYNLPNIHINIDEYKTNLKSYEEKLENIIKNKKLIQLVPNENKNNLNNENEIKKTKIDDLLKKIKPVKITNEEDLKNKKKIINTQIHDLNTELTTLGDKIKNIAEINLNDLKNKKEFLKKELNKKIILEEKLKIYRNNNKEWITHKFDDKCKCCKKNKIIHESIGYLKNIKNLEEEINLVEVTNTDLENIENKISEIDEYNFNLLKIENIKNKNKIHELNLDEINENLKNLEKNTKNEIKINKINEKIKLNKEKINNMINYENLVDKEKIIISEIEKLNEQINLFYENIEGIQKLKKYEAEENLLENNLIEENNNLKNIIEKLSTNKIELKIQNDLKKEYTESEKIKNIYGEITNLYKNGFMEYILSERLKVLEVKINNIIRTLSDYEIKIKVEKDKISFYKHVNLLNNEISELNVKNLCGYERIVFNLALRLGLNNMNIMTKNNFMIIDEGFSAADSINITKFSNILEVIKKEYEVCILISHIDEIKNQKGNIIKIEYDEKTFDSKINVV